jgi:hypothetical protein
MSGKEMVPWGTAIVGDLLNFLQIPGSGFVGKFGDKYFERKRREAAEILIAEVAKGSPEPINFVESDVDPLLEITLMDGLISRRMVTFLRYGGTDGENEDAGRDLSMARN